MSQSPENLTSRPVVIIHRAISDIPCNRKSIYAARLKICGLDRMQFDHLKWAACHATRESNKCNDLQGRQCFLLSTVRTEGFPVFPAKLQSSKGRGHSCAFGTQATWPRVACCMKDTADFSNQGSCRRSSDAALTSWKKSHGSRLG